MPLLLQLSRERRQQQTVRAFHPWISSGTRALIDGRNAGRRHYLVDDEKALRKQVKCAVKANKSAWFDEMLAEGDWGQIRKLREGYLQKQGRLKNLSGELLDSDSCAEPCRMLWQSDAKCNGLFDQPSRQRIRCSLAGFCLLIYSR